MKEKLHSIRVIRWAFSLAWKFNKKILISCFFLVALVSLLPAIALIYNKAIINALDIYIQTGHGTFDAIMPQIIVFGVLTALSGLSNRLNEEFIYSIMFDSYYFGMEEVLMDSVQAYTMEEWMQKDTRDDFHSCVLREGALTDVISGCCTLLGKLLGFISLLGVAFSMSKIVFCISVIYIIAVIVYNLLFVEKMRMSWQKIRDKERLAEYYEKMPVSPDCAKELRIFKSKEYILQNWRDTYTSIYDYELKNSLDVELKTFYSGVGFYLFLAAMTIYSLFLVAHGQMTSDVLLVIFTLCLNLFTTLSGVTRTLTLTAYGLYPLGQQYQLFGKQERQSDEQTREQSQRPQESETVFEARNLSFSYQGDKLALDNVSFSIQKGETIALVGLNGSGKTTLVQMLLSIYKPLSGELFFCGKNYKELEEGFLRNQIGTFFQDFYLFHMPLGENIGFGDVKNVNNVSKISQAVQKGGAESVVAKAPHGLDTFVHKFIEKSGVDFSGGESQKLAVSRAYMSDNDILIFDEPASMLDPISELEQFMNIKDTVGGKTAILISHRVGFARLADRILLMDHGKLAEVGTHDELMALNGLYAKFFRDQAQWYQEEVNA